MRKTAALILMLAVMLVMTACHEKTDVTPIIEGGSGVETPSVEVSDTKGVKTYCIFGLDARDPEQQSRSDVIMLVRVDNDAENIKLVSVYRDTLMDAGEVMKCNAAYAYGGAYYATGMLEDNLDIKIDGYVSSDFKSAIEMIDMLGGVELEVTDEEAGYANNYVKEMNRLYEMDAPMLEAGKHVLCGAQAVGYARVRYTEGWDYKRTERQRTVFALMVDKLRNADEDTKKAVIDKVLTTLHTDMSESALSAMTDSVLNYEIVDNTGFPQYKKGMSVSGLGSCVVPTDLVKNVVWLHEYLYGEKDYEPSEKVKEISEEIAY